MILLALVRCAVGPKLKDLAVVMPTTTSHPPRRASRAQLHGEKLVGVRYFRNPFVVVSVLKWLSFHVGV